jgi:hypothetical protein
MKKIWFFILLLPLAACLPVQTLEPLPTEIPSLTPSPSPTIEWFPPTATPEPSPRPELTPTQPVSIELGDVIFRDDFQNPEEWTLPVSDRGIVTIRDGEANIIINESNSYLLATRDKPDLTNFYAEITANPILCMDKDEYGLIFRLSGQGYYYRFVVHCDGFIKLEKITPGGPIILAPGMRSASVPVGAPSVLKLAVVAEWDQLHLFINGDYQITVSDFDDFNLQVGSFGIFARADGENAVTVSFSDLIVREILPK